MAASVLRCHFCFKKSSFRYLPIRYGSSVYDSYFVAVPNKPTDTEKTNESLRYREYPYFGTICPSKLYTGGARSSFDFELGLHKHLVWLEESGDAEKSFDEIFNTIEELLQPMIFIEKSAEQHYLNNTSNKKGYEMVLEKVKSRVTRSTNYLWDDPVLLNEIERLGTMDSKLTPSQMRLIEKYKLMGLYHGAQWEKLDRVKFEGLTKRIFTEQTIFTENVLIGLSHYKTRIDQADLVATLPVWLQKQLSVNKVDHRRGPWVVSLDDHIFKPFMEYCPSRPLREDTWLLKKSIASVAQDEHQISNSVRVGDILNARNDLSNLFDYDTYGDLMLSNRRMAGSLQQALSVLAKLTDVLKGKAQRDYNLLKSYAARDGLPTVEWWDIDYYRRRSVNETYTFDARDLGPYFNYDHVLQTMMDMSSRLFGVTFTDYKSEVTDVLHEDVEVYQVTDTATGEELGVFYLDAFTRPNKAYTFEAELGRPRCDLLNLKPFSYLTFAIQPRQGHQPIPLTMAEVQEMFKMFGRTLQHVLSECPYSDLHSTRYIEQDSEGIVPTLFTMFIENPTVLKSLSRHAQTDQPLDDDQIYQVINSTRHMSAIPALREVLLSSFDLEIHSEEGIEPDDVYGRLIDENMPLKRHNRDNTPSSSVEVFGRSPGCAYYVYVWNEMIAADLYDEFNQVGFEDLDALGDKVGRRFRESYFTPGSSLAQTEIFRNFMGRDPCTAAYLNRFDTLRMTNELRDSEPEVRLEEGTPV